MTHLRVVHPGDDRDELTNPLPTRAPLGCNIDDRIGLKIAIADVNIEGLNETGKQVAAIVGEANVLVIPTDVSKFEEVVRLRDKVYDTWGEVSI